MLHINTLDTKNRALSNTSIGGIRNKTIKLVGKNDIVQMKAIGLLLRDTKKSMDMHRNSGCLNKHSSATLHSNPEYDEHVRTEYLTQSKGTSKPYSTTRLIKNK